MSIDPVCGMKVERDKAAGTIDYQGRTISFCSQGCFERFKKEDSRFPNNLGYDLIIIGGGPAGLTAAVYAATMKMRAFLVTRDLGGQAVDSVKILNYMGFDFITGPELVEKFKDQLIHSHYIDHLIGEVVQITRGDDGFSLVTSGSVGYAAKAVIVATGMTRRSLGVPGEEEFQRKGVFYGNTQDPSFVVGEDVAVIGGGNSALQIVEKLSSSARTIHLISDYELSADEEAIERLRGYNKLKIYENARVLRIFGETNVKGLALETKNIGRTVEIPVKGVFIAIGLHPNSKIVADLVALDEDRQIIVGPDCSTSRAGIFAAGDVTNTFGKRIVIASGEGAKAALAAKQFIDAACR
jgi:alkyl hydroperoxide reductase subunit F